jgi:hypothetical protein
MKRIIRSAVPRSAREQVDLELWIYSKVYAGRKWVLLSRHGRSPDELTLIDALVAADER